jgi:hypothetical protein
MNCFGKEYAAGSALFHWLLDEKYCIIHLKQEITQLNLDILYRNNVNIIYKYV